MMRSEVFLEDVARAYYQSQNTDMPDIEYDAWVAGMKREDRVTEKRKRRPHNADLQCLVFPQTWGSTALGFGGMGGSACTQAYTVVVYFDHRSFACVYFGGRLAYKVSKPSEEFWDACKKYWLAANYEKEKLEKYGEEIYTTHQGE